MHDLAPTQRPTLGFSRKMQVNVVRPQALPKLHYNTRREKIFYPFTLPFQNCLCRIEFQVRFLENLTISEDLTNPMGPVNMYRKYLGG